MKSIKFVENETAILLATSYFEQFLRSPLYLEWRNYESLKVKYFKQMNGTYNNDNEIFSNILVILPERNEITPPPDDFFGRSLWHVDPNEVTRILRYNWMCNFIAIAEVSPISLSVACATEDRRGFPLIYVNENFKLLTGYHRDEVIGLNCKFLQKNVCHKKIPMTKTDTTNLSKLSHALKSGKKMKTTVLNCKKNGELFRNFIAIKPIFDIRGTYVFVIAMQADVTNKFQIATATKYVDKLFAYLPDRL